MVSSKILVSGDVGATLTGMNGTAFNDKGIFIFRESGGAFTGYFLADNNEQITASTPTTQTLDPSFAAAPVISMGFINSSGSAVTPSGTLNTNGTLVTFQTYFKALYELFDASPQSRTLGMSDVGAANSLSSVAYALETITNYSMSADVGAFTETGNAANLLVGRKIAADVGSFVLTGQTANLLFGHKLAANSGAFSLTGYAADLIYNTADTLVAETGVFALTGNAAGLYRALRLTADTGAFALTGQDAGLFRGYAMSAAPGTFVLTGQAANLLRSRIMAASTGSFALTGNAAQFIRGRIFLAEAGQFALTGYAANLLVNRILRLPQKFVRLLPDNRWVARDVHLMATDRLAMYGRAGEIDKLGFDASPWLDGSLIAEATLDFGKWPVTLENNTTIARLTVPHAGGYRYGRLEIIATDGRSRTIDIELVPL